MERVLRREPVSSRAPVWGASVEQLQRENELLFQVVPPCGGHLEHDEIIVAGKKFQVVPPCGGHLLPVGDHLHQNGFKSCPRVGGIHGVRKLLQGDGVSSRAPVWGASAVSVMFGIVEEVSSRAPVWGASAIRRASSIRFLVSSRAPVWGASSLSSWGSPTTG